MENSIQSFAQFCSDNQIVYSRDRETGCVIASCKDRNTRYGVRYGNGKDERDAIRDLMDALTGKKG